MLDEPYFQLPPPKSTGRELFNLAWLEKTLAKITALEGDIPPQDVQTTLLEFTAQSIALALRQIARRCHVVCWFVAVARKMGR